MRKIKAIAASAAAAVLLGASSVGAAPVSYTGGTYAENFDAFPWFDGHNSTNWVNDYWVPGWYASGVEWLFASMGLHISETADKSVFIYGRDDDDNALGSQLGDANQPWPYPVRFGVQIVNNTGQVLTDFTLSYFGELWRQGYDKRVEQLSFDYAVNVSSLASDGYIAAPQLNFAALTRGAQTGYGNSYRTPISATVSALNWLPGESLWLRWTDVDDPGLYPNSALAIDDLEFSAQRVTPPPPVINEPTVTQAAAVPEPNTAALAALSMLTLSLLLRIAGKRRS